MSKLTQLFSNQITISITSLSSHSTSCDNTPMKHQPPSLQRTVQLFSVCSPYTSKHILHTQGGPVGRLSRSPTCTAAHRLWVGPSGCHLPRLSWLWPPLEGSLSQEWPAFLWCRAPSLCQLARCLAAPYTGHPTSKLCHLRPNTRYDSAFRLCCS